MNLEQFVIFFAVFLVGLSLILLSAGLATDRRDLQKSGYRAILATSFLLVLDTLLLGMRLFLHDFTYAYVSRYSSLSQPVIFNFSAIWTGVEGSLLVLAVLLAGISLIGLLFLPDRQLKTRSYYLLFVAWFMAILLIIIGFFENPFKLSLPAAVDGSGLLLPYQSWSMVFHPIFMNVAYSMILVAFCYFMMLVMTQDLSKGKYLSRLRACLLPAWVSLSMGNLIGLWWTYHELGWGSLWTWDSVESVALIAWVLLTSLLHVWVLMRRRSVWYFQTLIVWLFVVMSVFFGVLLSGTSLFSSIHSLSPSRYPRAFFLMVFIYLLATFIGVAWMAIRNTSKFSQFRLQSTVAGDIWIFQANIIFSLIAGSVAVGIMTPPMIKWLVGHDVAFTSVFFVSLTLPSVIILLFMQLGQVRDIQSQGRLRWMAWVAGLGAGIGTLIWAWHLGIHHLLALAGIGAAVVSLIRNPVGLGIYIWKGRPRGAMLLLPFSSLILHCGFMLFCLGVILSSSLAGVRVFPLVRGAESIVFGHTFHLNSIRQSVVGSRVNLSASLVAQIMGQTVYFNPERHYYTDSRPSYPRVAVERLGWVDYYLILEDYNDPRHLIFTLHRRPFVVVVWLGGVLLLLGGLLRMVTLNRQEEA